MSTTTAPKQHQKGEMKEGKEGEKNIRQTNIIAAKSVADAVRTSLGPRGMDKMIISPNGETIITNDGATIIQQLKLQHPCALMMSELSKSQDIEAGDGTTTVTILAGAMLSAANILLNKGVNPSVIAPLHFLAKLKIMVVKDIERDDIEFICKTIEAVPIASIDGFTEDKLGHAENVEEVSIEDEDKIVKITGVKGTAPCVSVLVRGANRLVLDEAERSLHDALCVVRSLVKCKYLCPGGGAMEMELCCKLKQWAETLKGEYGLCVKEYAEAFEIIPYTLAENAGLNPMELVTQLKLAHLNGEKNAGISMRKDNKVQGSVDDMTSLNVVNPLLVFLSAVKLATDTVALILKIDNIVVAR
ncbi:T-complex protein 1 subunit delta, putative [Entamoeba histolytica HM-1:IMSS]|uniref:T-complex protein 1 subunit delta, putative n=2 Tax=Entamoeba histolytica (strain ATCC 30459 / HM-1:IMSS / ABRM) TaxID=294381 RepID=B1N453_ENTH1|nr:T-complex protein 1 subunit delta, putative [Entamoeba histolytica HM-1:IMSS]EDS89257.1 T-complex protein 1 subunit delta, putative [Entamoeba histolytica HM-1:IMSS]ENY60615.1 T-complex protein 1 subunit delta, putative [Entamoeba histolytica HM-1:IMSS-A]|eukprot:XP_001913969.1 T-complex protein 1 subunit delta, putative [Entamoeba histolytica HM-1:IMSS]